MGDEQRSVNSLPGGESFLVSLSLTLGLASLSSNRLRVESLFIDEGFGTRRRYAARSDAHTRQPTSDEPQGRHDLAYTENNSADCYQDFGTDDGWSAEFGRGSAVYFLDKTLIFFTSCIVVCLTIVSNIKMVE
ncbi:hypothetical protein [Undibacterium sp. RTI2.2]|uniref:hypothetical protein n=1 Tax=unclassified Undibacterium TaxID=2630295 RepID=UPI003A599A0A